MPVRSRSLRFRGDEHSDHRSLDRRVRGRERRGAHEVGGSVADPGSDRRRDHRTWRSWRRCCCRGRCLCCSGALAGEQRLAVGQIGDTAMVEALAMALTASARGRVSEARAAAPDRPDLGHRRGGDRSGDGVMRQRSWRPGSCAPPPRACPEEAAALADHRHDRLDRDAGALGGSLLYRPDRMPVPVHRRPRGLGRAEALHANGGFVVTAILVLICAPLAFLGCDPRYCEPAATARRAPARRRRAA